MRDANCGQNCKIPENALDAASIHKARKFNSAQKQHRLFFLCHVNETMTRLRCPNGSLEGETKLMLRDPNSDLGHPGIGCSIEKVAELKHSVVAETSTNEKAVWFSP